MKKRLSFVAMVILLIFCNCCIVYASDVCSNDKYALYDNNPKAKGYVHTFLVESGFGYHRANASIELMGSDTYLLSRYSCGYQFGGDATWTTVCGYTGETRIYKQKTDRFTYVNTWLQIVDDDNNYYIDAPSSL